MFYGSKKHFIKPFLQAAVAFHIGRCDLTARDHGFELRFTDPFGIASLSLLQNDRRNRHILLQGVNIAEIRPRGHPHAHQQVEFRFIRSDTRLLAQLSGNGVQAIAAPPVGDQKFG